ncbi:MAG TPA: hypothetical protein VNG71_11850 [Pyrinomonadaceae bacterium]|nr:hypothetical protein [Pyrinomonadaceae bacterium]
MSDPVRQWRFFAFKENPAFWSSEKPLNIVAFRKFSQPGDLDFYDDSPLQQFYSHITKDYMPPDFGIVQLTLEPPEDGCGHHVRTRPNLEWKASFIGPQLRMSVAIIENVSNDPISVGRVILKENRSAQLQSRDAVSAALQSLPAVKQELFGPRTLRAGESLVIPIELSLKTERKDLERYFASLYAAQISPSRYSELLTEADVATALTFPNNKGTDVAISAPALQRIINRQIVDFASMSEYVYGPSVSIESLEIDRFGYLVRRFEPGKLLITSDFNTEVGSCPFVYTYSARQESWLREGVILYGLDSKLRESTDEIPLQRFNGRVLIREEDPEDSFIDSISVRATGRDGNEILLLPENTKLLASDGDYVQLRQGEQMFLDFSLPPGFIGRKFSLVASGYYLPYKSRPAKFFKRQRPLRVQRVHSLQ